MILIRQRVRNMRKESIAALDLECPDVVKRKIIKSILSE